MNLKIQRGMNSMNNLPCVEASLVIEGKVFDLEEFTKEIEISPTQIRTVDDWPEVIKNNLNLPEELQPRNVWCISNTTKCCKEIESSIHKIKLQLEGKEQKLIEFCEKYHLTKGLYITIHAEAMNLPEIVLLPSTVLYFGNLKVEIGFDMYIY